MESKTLSISHLIIGGLVFLIGIYQFVQTFMNITFDSFVVLQLLMNLTPPILIGLGFIISGLYFWEE